MPSLEERNSDSLRRGKVVLYDSDCRRTAGRSGGYLRQAVCRPCWKGCRPCLWDAGIARTATYVTNAVKHFKWEPRGKRRIHKKPSPPEIAACRPWLQAELRIIRPKTVVRLGATATAAILGPKVRVLKDRGRVFSSAMAARVFVTIHPSLLLRLTDRSEAKREYDLFVRDLRVRCDRRRSRR